MPSISEKLGKLMAATYGDIAIRTFRAAIELGRKHHCLLRRGRPFSIHRLKADALLLLGGAALVGLPSGIPLVIILGKPLGLVLT